MITNLQDFSELKSSLKKDLEQLQETIAFFTSKESQITDDISSILQRLSTDSFKILVVGEFSTGKSTFLNAIIGRQLLPTETTETTATINIIKYGEKPNAIVHFWGPRDQFGRETSPGKTEQIELEKLSRYVTSLTKESNEIAKNVKYVEILLPSKYCQNSVEFVDTPGLNTTYEYHELTTLEYLQNGHFGIMLLNATQFLTASELKYLERFRRYMNKVMFVVNYVNQMPPDDSFEDNKHYFERKLKEVLTTQKEITLYPVNALLAEQGDQKNSGLDIFLRDLEAFLTSDMKAKEMLLPPIIQSSNIIRTLMKNNDLACSALSFSPTEFESKLEKLRPKLNLLKSKQNDLLEYIDRNKELIVQRYAVFANEQIQKKALQIKKEIIEWQGELDSLREDLSEYLKSVVIEIDTTIQEYMHTEVKDVLLELSSRYDDLLDEISDYQDQLASSLHTNSGLPTTKLSDLNITSNESLDFSDIVFQFGGSFAIGYLFSAILTGPLGWIAAILGSGVWGGFLQKRAKQKQLADLAQQIYNKLLQQFNDNIPKGSNFIRQTFSQTRKDLRKKIDTQLASIQGTIESIKLEMQQEESKVHQAKKRYREFNDRLEKILERLEKTKKYLTER